MSSSVQLPVTSTPSWEVKDGDEHSVEDESDLQSVADSYVIHQSLRQSRNAWLRANFPKFSSKVRGKHLACNPHPHTIHLIGKCELEIGPHSFADTNFYEVQYISEPAKVTTYQFAQGSMHSPFTGSFGASSSSVSSLGSMTQIDPELIAQVNAAASSNPVLQELLTTAAEHQASLEQLKTLAALIQPLAAQSIAPHPHTTLDNPNVQTAAVNPLGVTSYPPAPHELVMKSDLIIEYRENQSERLRLPHNVAFGERNFLPNGTGRSDVDLGLFIPTEEARKENSVERPAILRLRNAPPMLVDIIWNWLSEEARLPGAKEAFKQKAKEGAAPVYLQHRLPEGEMLSHLRTISKNYQMKSLKSASASTRPKRAPRKRKSPTVQTSTLPPPETINLATQPATEAPAPTPTPKKPPEPPTDPTTIITQKKRKVTKPVKALPAFACSVCGMTNVPLMQGGRYCRTCIETGAARNAALASPAQPHMASLTPIAPQPPPQTSRIDSFRGFVHMMPAQQPYVNQNNGNG